MNNSQVIAAVDTIAVKKWIREGTAKCVLLVAAQRIEAQALEIYLNGDNAKSLALESLKEAYSDMGTEEGGIVESGMMKEAVIEFLALVKKDFQKNFDDPDLSERLFMAPGSGTVDTWGTYLAEAKYWDDEHESVRDQLENLIEVVEKDGGYIEA